MQGDNDLLPKPLKSSDKLVTRQDIQEVRFSPSGELFLFDFESIYRYSHSTGALESFTCPDSTASIDSTVRWRWRSKKIADVLVESDSTLFVVDSELQCIFRISNDEVHRFAGIMGVKTHNLGATRLETSFGGELRRLVRLGDDLFLLTSEELYKIHGNGTVAILHSTSPTAAEIRFMLALPSVGKLLLLARAPSGILGPWLLNPEDGSPKMLHWPVVPRDIMSVHIFSVVEPNNPILLVASPLVLYLQDVSGLCQSITAAVSGSNELRTFSYDATTSYSAYLLQPKLVRDQAQNLPIAKGKGAVYRSWKNWSVSFCNLMDYPELFPMTSSFVHQQSGTEFKLHEQVLRARNITPKMLDVLASATLPVSLIPDIISDIYGDKIPLSNNASIKLRRARRGEEEEEEVGSPPIDEADILASQKQLASLLHVLRECELDSRILEGHFARMVRNYLSVDSQFELLMFIWNSAHDDRLLQIVINCLRPATLIFVEKAAELCKFSSVNPTAWVSLIRMHQDTAPLYSPPMKTDAPGPLAVGLRKHFPLVWNSSGAPPPSVDERVPGSFYFCIDSVDGYAESFDWIVFSRWSYVRNLMLSGLAEAKERLVVLPPDFPKYVLLSILAFCHATIAPTLTYEEYIYLLQHAELYGLFGGTFSSLISRAQSQVTAKLKKSPQIEWFPQIKELSSKKAAHIDELAINFIATNWKFFSNTHQADLKQLPEEWCSKIIKAL